MQTNKLIIGCILIFDILFLSYMSEKVKFFLVWIKKISFFSTHLWDLL